MPLSVDCENAATLYPLTPPPPPPLSLFYSNFRDTPRDPTAVLLIDSHDAPYAITQTRLKANAMGTRITIMSYAQLLSTYFYYKNY